MNQEVDEFRLLQRATRLHWWRWRSEEKRLRRKCVVCPFELHLRELQLLYRVWRETRQDAGLTHVHEKLPPAAKRIFERVAWRKCEEYLRAHPQ
jgi:hypothetical protein